MGTMPQRRLGPFTVSAIGLGCMNLSHAYGVPPDRATAVRLLNEALDLGYTHLDTAFLYGGGANETLVGEAVGHRRGEYLLASKCGLGPDATGKRTIDGRPEAIRRTCEEALRRLRTDVIDLYYLHRLDAAVPVEDSAGALAGLVAQGKIRGYGLSEVSAATLRRAHAVHPVAAVQSEYALWTRNPEIAVLDACAELGTGFVAFSPLGRGFLAGGLGDVATLAPGDIRRGLPRFRPDAYARNLALLDGLAAVAREAGCTPAQLALAWTLAKAPHVVPIPGTTRIDHLRENAGAATLSLDPATVARLESLINRGTVDGPRYPESTLAEIDTEDFA
ncbi:aldo/keto reductase [Azospirillum halopraeferens]|uniref:aldo/keto reductase n=1 Tax=Azospirillum halopraeferens TaxID=34010 RepID=UPI0003FCBC43|nr:aldo/keto reductase [Azospirillum halopraeferens]